jgi:hypothetical protein
MSNSVIIIIKKTKVSANKTKSHEMWPFESSYLEVKSIPFNLWHKLLDMFFSVLMEMS